MTTSLVLTEKMLRENMVYSVPVDVFFSDMQSKGLRTMFLNALKNDSITYVGQLIKRDYWELRRCPNVGKTGMKQAISKLEKFGLILGVTTDLSDEDIGQIGDLNKVQALEWLQSDQSLATLNISNNPTMPSKVNSEAMTILEDLLATATSDIHSLAQNLIIEAQGKLKTDPEANAALPDSFKAIGQLITKHLQGTHNELHELFGLMAQIAVNPEQRRFALTALSAITKRPSGKTVKTNGSSTPEVNG